MGDYWNNYLYSLPAHSAYPQKNKNRIEKPIWE